MTDLFALPPKAELNDVLLKVSLAEGIAGLVAGTTSKREALLRLVSVNVAVLAAEDAETAQLATLIDHVLTLYRQRAQEQEREDAEALKSINAALLQGDGEPTVVYGPAVQAKLDSDPALKAAFAAISEKMTDAMRAVKAGRYPSFDAAMEAMGSKPEPLTDQDREAIAEFEADYHPGNHTKQ